MADHQYKPGDRVVHGHLGTGVVRLVNDNNGHVTVRFEAGAWSGPASELSLPRELYDNV